MNDVVAKKPPTGMTSHQRSIAEKAVRLRFEQMSRAVKAAHEDTTTSTVTVPKSYEIVSYFRANNDDGTKENPLEKTPLAAEAHKIRQTCLAFLKRAERLRKQQEQKMSKANSNVAKLEREMADSRDEAIIRINFNGQSEDMLAFLEGLPTVATIERRLLKAGLTPGENFQKLLTADE